MVIIESKEAIKKKRTEASMLLIPQFVKDGFEMAYPGRFKEWLDMIVENIQYYDLLKCIVETMKALSDGDSFILAEKILKQAPLSESSYGYCLWQIAKFSKKGMRFLKQVWINMSFEQMRELERIEQENKEKAEEDPDRELLDYYIEEGLKYVYPERYIQWIDFVKNNYKNFTVVQDVLNTMKSLARGVSFERVEDLLDHPRQNSESYELCLKSIAKFSKYGVEFVKSVDLNGVDADEIYKLLNRLDGENDIYKELAELRALEQKLEEERDNNAEAEELNWDDDSDTDADTGSDDDGDFDGGSDSDSDIDDPYLE